MNAVEMNGHARRLLEAYGPKATLIAAQKARILEKKGDAEQAEFWKRIRSMIADMRRDALV